MSCEIIALQVHVSIYHHYEERVNKNLKELLKILTKTPPFQFSKTIFVIERVRGPRKQPQAAADPHWMTL